VNPAHLEIDFGAERERANAQALELWETYGCFVARDLMPPREVQQIRHELSRLIQLMLQDAGIEHEPQPGDRFDAGFDRLAQQSPERVEAIFGAARRLTSVHQFSVHRALLELSQVLMKTDMVMSSPYKPVRIDHEVREGALLGWHQDYPYAHDSMDSVVYWMPLQDVNGSNGCVRVIPGSHRAGVRPVVMLEPPPGIGNGIRGIRLADPDSVASLSSIEIPVRAGDVLVFSTCLLHRSQKNTTPQARWTVQVRHGNFLYPQAIQKHWPRGHYERHWFDETHPELVVSLGDEEA